MPKTASTSAKTVCKYSKTANTESSGQIYKTPLPVSKKFYSYICERIAESCRMLPDGSEILEITLKEIHFYLTTGKIPGIELPIECRLIFSLLRPEIDRAMARSKAARSRARKKTHPARQTTEQSPLHVTTDTSPQDKKAEKDTSTDLSTPTQPKMPAPSLTRSERRRMLRKQKRAARRKQVNRQSEKPVYETPAHTDAVKALYIKDK